ncbi:hypothetical protein F4679DRAFT_574358 [Xylaria curta]|nr:hypothetical protein F4679DRAFT_574358 [Xylaria curta]
MSIAIQDLSDDEVVRITNVLARRPEYGIAVPSRRWLQRQEEKIRDLPKELLKSTNLLKRIATKIADTIDPNIVDPRAILCKTHSGLNPFLIRRLFIALAYEVTVHTDALRSWPGRTSAPELSAFVGRLDSIAALWTEPQLFHDIYGSAPFDGHHVFVKSACEACCLAAVGASGRALADLRASLVDRMERRRAKPGQEPRLFRVVEAWIDHLQKHREGPSRSEECRAMSETVVHELRIDRSQIEAWRAEQKQVARHSVYSELRRTKTGTKIAPLPTSASHKRSTRHGIPIALADIETAADQRHSAMYTHRAESIYRPDSLSGNSVVNERQRLSRNLPPGPRSPRDSFTSRFEQAMSINDEPSPEDERDYDEEERSRARVEEWWASMLQESRLDLGQRDDAQSVVSMVHPAFRPSGNRIAESVAGSALPSPLHVKKDRGDRGTVASEWTDCTVYTVDDSSNKSQSTISRHTSSSKKHRGDASTTNWPAPPHGRRYPPTARDNRGPNRKTKEEGNSSRAPRPPSSVYDSDDSVSSSVYDRHSMTSERPRASNSGYDGYSVASGF